MPARSRIASSSLNKIEDPRFDTSKWDKQSRRPAAVEKADRDISDSGSSASQIVNEENDEEDDDEGDEEISDEHDEEGEEEDEDEDNEEEKYGSQSRIQSADIDPPKENNGASKNGDKVVKPLSAKELAAYEAKRQKRGIVYISRIPHGMTVAKVRHLLGGFGDIERLYLQDGREKESGQKLTGRRAKSAHFTEGWVEFADKRVAKAVAEMLNAEPIGAAAGGSGGGKGGKKSSGKGLRRWKDEVWTMKYLSGFKWYMLSEQLANERASRASRVRAELSQSAYEQKDYLRKVERARVMREKEARRKAREDKAGESSAPPKANGQASQQSSKERSFRQREAVTRDVREMREKRPRDERDEHNANSSKRVKAQSHRKDESRSQALQGALAKIF